MILEGLDVFGEWTLAWTEAELWLKADIVPLVKETMNEDGTTKVNLRPVAVGQDSDETP